MKTLFFVLVMSLSMQYVFSQTLNSTQLVTIDLEKAFSDQKEVFLSNFIDSVVFIPLENSPSSLIGDILVRYELTNEYIIVKHNSAGINKIFIFDRRNGKFLREIGKQGRGPGEFAQYGELAYNHVKSELYAINYSGDILVYDLSGKNVDIIKKPYLPDTNLNIPNLTREQNEKFGSGLLRFYDILDSDVFVGYFQNFSGFENRKLILLNKSGVLKIFPNYQRWDRGSGGGFGNAPGGFAKFYKWDNKLYFLESFCDTLYQVTVNSLIPRYYFDTTPFKPEYSKQGKISSNMFNYNYIWEIKENKKHIFLVVSKKRYIYLGVIEKESNNVVVSKKGSSDNSGLIDDINNLMDVLPNLFTQKNEMVYVIQPVELMKWFKDNPEKAALARTKLPWLKDIDEFSNPIIAIGKCKE